MHYFNAGINIYDFFRHPCTEKLKTPFIFIDVKNVFILSILKKNQFLRVGQADTQKQEHVLAIEV